MTERFKRAGEWQERMGSPWLVFKGDAFEALKLIPDGVVDLVITDPPYESLEKHRDSQERIDAYEAKKAAGEETGTRIPRLRDWFEIMPNERFPELLDELWRVMAENSHLYIFCDDETSDVIKRYVDESSTVRERPKKECFTWWKRIVWDKQLRTMGYHYPNQHEFVVFLEKGKRKLNSHAHTSVLTCKRVGKGELGRAPLPTEKPVELIRKLIQNSAIAGNLVLDPFCGSGSTGVAALLEGCEFLGFDKKPAAIEIARERLRAAMPIEK